MNDYDLINLDDKYVAKEGNAAINGNNIINGTLSVNTTNTIPVVIMNTNNLAFQVRFGNAMDGWKCGILQFGWHTTETRVSLGMYGDDHIITFNANTIYLNKNVVVNDTVSSNNSATIVLWEKRVPK